MIRGLLLLLVLLPLLLRGAGAAAAAGAALSGARRACAPSARAGARTGAGCCRRCAPRRWCCWSSALARPQLGKAATQVYTEGIDIMLAVDISGSMLAEDFQLDGQRANRLDAVKAVVREFLDRRPGDRVGLVLFAGAAVHAVAADARPRLAAAEPRRAPRSA